MTTDQKNDKKHSLNRSKALKRKKYAGYPETAAVPGWESVSQLLPPLSAEISERLEQFLKILQKIRPLKSQHRKNLPADIYSLSRELTEQRANLRLPYWSSPGSISAYLYYFLPWNIIRLCRLLGSPILPDPGAMRQPVLLDAGSGPLAMPLALWLARPEWRKLPLHIIASDSSSHILEIGKDIFREMTQDGSWRISLLKSPIEMLASKMETMLKNNSKIWLLSCVNTLNELAGRSFTKHREDRGKIGNGDQAPRSSIYERLLAAWEPLWGSETDINLFFMEPGTRLGGNIIMQMRRAALAAGFHAVQPCTHDGDCPLLDAGRHGASLTSSWCHFTFLPTRAPAWLSRLSEEAGLPKNSLSLSMLLAQKTIPRRIEKGLPARVLSRPFQASGVYGEARYACTAQGMVMLENAQRLPSGSLALAETPDGKRTDSKHGMPILNPYTEN